MIKRTIEISREPAHLTVRLGQLLLLREQETLASIPCEDIGVVLVDNARSTYSHAALTELAAAGAAVVVCGRDHLPAALLLPLANHSQVVSRLHLQMGASRPLRKRLWQQIVKAKVRAQAMNLPSNVPARAKLLALAGQVRSGDPANIEAQAAKIYWYNWLPDEEFRRDADGDALNSLLNYGYAVVRAALGRAIVAAGLVPALGIFHSHRANQFCLADDLIEPLRPLVDARARALYRQGYRELSPEAKRHLLELLAAPVLLADEEGPLMVQMHRYVASLVHCYCGEATRLLIPLAEIEEESPSSGS